MKPIQHYQLTRALNIDELQGKSGEISQKIFSLVLAKHERVMADAIIKWAKENDVTDVYLLDRDWVLAALREKAKREKDEPGHWMTRYPGDCARILTGQKGLYRCSKCDAKYDNVEGYKHCPNCGKLMDGVRYEL